MTVALRPKLPDQITARLASATEQPLSALEGLPVEILELIRNHLPPKSAHNLMLTSSTLFRKLSSRENDYYHAIFQEAMLEQDTRRRFFDRANTKDPLHALGASEDSHQSFSYYEAVAIKIHINTVIRGGFESMHIGQFFELLRNTNSAEVLRGIFVSMQFSHISRRDYLSAWRESARKGNEVAVREFLCLHERSQSGSAHRLNKNTFQTGFLSAVASGKSSCMEVFVAYKGFGEITGRTLYRGIHRAIRDDIDAVIQSLVEHERFLMISYQERVGLLKTAAQEGSWKVMRRCFCSERFCHQILDQDIQEIFLMAIGDHPDQVHIIQEIIQSPYFDVIAGETFAAAWTKSARHQRVDILRLLASCDREGTLSTKVIFEALLHAIACKNHETAELLINSKNFAKLSAEHYHLLCNAVNTLQDSYLQIVITNAINN